RAYLSRAVLTRGRLEFGKPRSEEDRSARGDVDSYFRFAGAAGEKLPLALYERSLSALAERRFEDELRDLDAALDAGLDLADAHATRAWFCGDRGKKSRERATALDEDVFRERN